jgi:hypothetical protein
MKIIWGACDQRSKMICRLAGLTTLVAFGLYLANAAFAQTPLVRDLLAVEFELNGLCRGGGLGEDATMKICDLRDKMGKALNAMGYCYGKEGKYGAQMEWHKCTKRSMRLQE